MGCRPVTKTPHDTSPPTGTPEVPIHRRVHTRNFVCVATLPSLGRSLTHDAMPLPWCNLLDKAYGGFVGVMKLVTTYISGARVELHHLWCLVSCTLSTEGLDQIPGGLKVSRLLTCQFA